MRVGIRTEPLNTTAPIVNYRLCIVSGQRIDPDKMGNCPLEWAVGLNPP